jgi:transposase
MLTPGQAHDLACAEPLLENADPDALIADKAYDADPFVDILTQRAITPVIPPKANRKIQRACDFALYCERNIVERFFISSSTSALSQHVTTNSPEIFLPECSWPLLQSCSTEDRP